MIDVVEIPMYSFLISVTEALDLVSPALVDHHKKVSYIAQSLATELGLPKEQRRDIFIAAILHDIGALSLKERYMTLEFELTHTMQHTDIGYKLLRNFPPFSLAADIVRFHHTWWNGGKMTTGGEEVPMGSHIVHLADRTAVLLTGTARVVLNSRDIAARVNKERGRMFAPDVMDAFNGLAENESFWLDAASPDLSVILRQRMRLDAMELDLEGLLGLADMFRRIIDFRSRFTATHSAGVAATAEAISALVGFSPNENILMRVAGYLHDLGKLAVPTSILEKPGKLTEEEFATIRGHTYFTYKVLEPISALAMVSRWASFHHERLDGKGYPFHLSNQNIDIGSRIMAVADVFTAITEDRPYRAGMDSKKAMAILEGMSGKALDVELVMLTLRHFDDITAARVEAQAEARAEYQQTL